MFDPRHGDLAIVTWHDGGPADERLAQFREWPDSGRPGKWHFIGTDLTAGKWAVTVVRRVGLIDIHDAHILLRHELEARVTAPAVVL
jgi:hypothetical protein